MELFIYSKGYRVLLFSDELEFKFECVFFCFIKIVC